MSGPKEIPIHVTSIYGAKARQGLVQLSIGEEHILTFPPTKAREIAMMLLECAESAETDELFLRFFEDRMGLDERQMVLLLRDFRHLRDEFRERDKTTEVQT